MKQATQNPYQACDLNDGYTFYASSYLINDLKAVMKEGDTIVNLAYTDYGGDFIQKVAIEYLIKNHPANIVVEPTSWNGKNCFIFGNVAEDWIESNKYYPLGFEDIESFYYEMEANEKRDGYTYFLNQYANDETVSMLEDGVSKLCELRESDQVLTSGLDYSNAELEAFCFEHGILTKIEDTFEEDGTLNNG